MNESTVCPKCEGKMIIGHYSGPVIDWEVEGEHKFLKDEGVAITTSACKTCGYMESYVQK